MPYRLEDGEAVASAIRRCAREQLDSAIEELSEGFRTDPVEAVHVARKALKKERSLLRLVRASLYPAERRRENAAFRDAARRLSGARDAEVMLQALDDLAERYAGHVPKATFAAIRERLDARRDSARSESMKSNVISDVAEDLKAARLRIDDWRLRGGGWAAIRNGLHLSYGDGRKSFKRARAQPTSENLHEWRKRSKDVWYHLRLLQPISPHTMQGHADAAHRLSDLLGDDHDLSVLHASLMGMSSEIPLDLEPVVGLIDHRRGQLQTEAMFLGERLYAETPKAFVDRTKRYWKVWRAESEAADASLPTELAEATRPG